jgi:hypothetical protein
MARQLTHSQHLIAIGGVSLAGLGLSEAACHLNHLCCVVQRVALGLLPTITLAAWRATQTLAFDHPRFFECLCQIFSIWPLVVCVAKAV